MNTENMTLEQIATRRSAIATLIETPEADLNALGIELDAMETRESLLNEQIETRSALLDRVANTNTGAIIATGGNSLMEKESQVFTLASPEYRSAFFNSLAGNPLTEIEQRAFTETTATFGGSLPTETADTIWSNIKRDHSIVSDIKNYSLGSLFEVSVAESTLEGKGKKVAEGAKNVDMKIKWVKKTLSGNDYDAIARISYAMGSMNGQALESFIVEEIQDQLGDAIADDVVASIIADVNAANKVTLTAVTFAELSKQFGKVSQKGEIKTYLNNTSLYDSLVSMVDTNGRPIFQPNAQLLAEGAFVGSTLRKESSVPNNTILIGVPQAVVGNFVTNPMVQRANDIQTNKHVFSGYARYEAKLLNDLAFVVVTIGAGE